MKTPTELWELVKHVQRQHWPRDLHPNGEEKADGSIRWKCPGLEYAWRIENFGGIPHDVAVLMFEATIRNNIEEETMAEVISCDLRDTRSFSVSILKKLDDGSRRGMSWVGETRIEAIVAAYLGRSF